MTKAEAWREAERRWGAYSDPYRTRGWVRLRRRNVKNRCEVGWERGIPWEFQIMGKGPTWEAAFAAAEHA